jgi:hypothetical protein
VLTDGAMRLRRSGDEIAGDSASCVRDSDCLLLRLAGDGRPVYHFVYHCDRYVLPESATAIFGQKQSPLI